MNINANRKESKSKTAGRYSTKRHAYNTDNISIGLSKEVNDYVFLQSYITLMEILNMITLELMRIRIMMITFTTLALRNLLMKTFLK